MECPNCITPWKCNGPHLEPISDKMYRSIHGYFIFKGHEWVFMPIEAELNTDDLLSITDTLRNLNEHDIR